jgi:hypothetical protein
LLVQLECCCCNGILLRSSMAEGVVLS